MSYFVVCTVALVVSALTLFSGFGLGTLLMPAFAVFFPLPVAIAATAAVHLANNVFKLGLVGRWAHWPTAIRFGIPAVAGSIAGAYLLRAMTRVPAVAAYTIGSSEHRITLVKLVVAAIIAAFAALDLSPRYRKASFPPAYIPVGGVFSGFFGGLSGIQGALRTAFLTRAGLSRDAFIGTGVVCAVAVDLARIPVYAEGFGRLSGRTLGLVAAASLAAFIGSFAGSRLVKKVTMETLHAVIGVMLVLMAAAMASGLV
jgi:uncharacterized membrane protein YfcA